MPAFSGATTLPTIPLKTGMPSTWSNFTSSYIAASTDPDRSRDILAGIPMGCWGMPDDLATAILFLVSPASSYVTATTIPVDGG